MPQRRQPRTVDELLADTLERLRRLEERTRRLDGIPTIETGSVAGGVLAGTYPNPGFADDMATQAELDGHIVDPADAHDASAVSYDNAVSGLLAVEVQAAIDEVVAGGGGGAPGNADYLVGTSDPGLTNEIVVGPTPGGELGNTWASPTVDATHSGSSHAATQAAAEATAAGALSGHAGAADPHTGYILESLLDAKGDLISASANDTPAILTAGADDTILMADASQAAGLKWAASAAPSHRSLPGDVAAVGTADTWMRSDAAILREFAEINVTEGGMGGTTGAVVTLMTIVLPANTLGTTGAIEVFAAGTVTGILGTRQVRLAFGSALIIPLQTITVAGDWEMRARIYADGATNAQKCAVRMDSQDGREILDYVATVQDSTVNLNVRVSGQISNAADDVTCEMMEVRQIR